MPAEMTDHVGITNTPDQFGFVRSPLGMKLNGRNLLQAINPRGGLERPADVIRYDNDWLA